MPQRAWVASFGGLWTVKSDARQVITAYDTEAEAIVAARSLLAETGGGELVRKDQFGGVVDRESIPRRSI
ncbi:DUF2188 domain-containing protein [Microbacterium sp. 2FI]|uniref:DUF2188 domain-containing protein n=1 Tax=Microbacterium sp. 2FI TaxID=2502193 RepID=UPI0010F5D334|nr:DUF2188 domain-containing protein [Microbacterium sp. 2FI]